MEENTNPTIGEQLLENFNFARAYSYGISTNKTRYEDFAQDACVAVLQATQDKPEAVITAAYMKSAVFSVVVRQWRRERKIVVTDIPLEYKDTARPTASIEASYEVKEQLERVRSIVTADEWQAICLFSQGYSRPEIAAEMEVTARRVKLLLENVRRKAKEIA